MYTVILHDGESRCDCGVQHNSGSTNDGKYDLSK